MVREEAVWKQNIVNLYLQCRSFWSFFFFFYLFPYLRGTCTCNVSVWYVKYNEIKQFCLWSLDPLRKLTIRLRARNFYRINLVVFYLKCCNLIHNAKHYLFHNRQWVSKNSNSVRLKKNKKQKYKPVLLSFQNLVDLYYKVDYFQYKF